MATLKLVKVNRVRIDNKASRPGYFKLVIAETNETITGIQDVRLETINGTVTLVIESVEFELGQGE